MRRLAECIGERLGRHISYVQTNRLPVPTIVSVTVALAEQQVVRSLFSCVMQLDQVLRMAAGAVGRVIEPFSAALGVRGDNEADAEAEATSLNASNDATFGIPPGFRSVDQC